MKIIRAVALAIGIAGAWASAASADNASFNLGECKMDAGAIDGNFKTGDFTIPGHVHLACPTRDVDADHAKGNQKSRLATLLGNVIIHDRGGSSGAFSTFGTGNQSASQGPSTLTTDRLDIDSGRKLYTATGNVHYVQGSRSIDAEKGTLDDISKDLTLYTLHFTEGTQKVDAHQGVMNSNSHMMDLTGAVHVVDGDRKMDADHVVYNTQSGDLHARGNVVMRFPGGEQPQPAAPAAKKKKKKLIPF
jgi:lipopolysaccharide assembly outer membrane protein LptD (OstA)